MRHCPNDILIAGNIDSASERAADIFVCTAVKATAIRGVFTVALPGGSTPRRMFELLGSSELAVLVPWDKTHVFFTDERCVPPDHPDSNFRQAHDLLLSRVPIPAVNIHRFNAELPPDKAAAAYEDELRISLGSEPTLDLVILGMGADFHTASLFPNSPALEIHDRLAIAHYVDSLGAYRLTLALDVLRSAREILVMAMGQGKAAALSRALSEDIDPTLRPIQAIMPTHGRMLWIVDEAAASDL